MDRQLMALLQQLKRNQYLQQARRFGSNLGRTVNDMFYIPLRNPNDSLYNPTLERTMFTLPNGRNIPYYDYIGAD